MADWTLPPNSIAVLANLHGFTMGIPFYFLLIMYWSLEQPNHKFITWLEKICDYKYVMPVCMIGIVLSFVVFYLNVPVMLGSWTTVALTIAGTLLIYSLAVKKLSNLMAIVLSVGIMGMWIGFWEVPYQWGMKLVYDLPQIGTTLAWNMIYWESIIEIPMAGCGLWIVIVLNNKYKLFSFNKWFYIFFGLYVAMMVLWFVMGFWVDVWYNWDAQKWIQTVSFDKPAMFTYKISKVFMLLSFVALLWRRDDFKVGVHNSGLPID
jgi:hypothetical protein